MTRRPRKAFDRRSPFTTQSLIRLTGNDAGIASSRGALTFSSFLSSLFAPLAVFSGSVEARYIQVALPVQRMPLCSVDSPLPEAQSRVVASSA